MDGGIRRPLQYFGLFRGGGELARPFRGTELDDKHQRHQRHADDIGGHAGENQHQAAGAAGDPLIPGHMGPEVALQRGGHAENTDQRGRADQNHLPRRGIDQQHSGI